MDYKAKVLYKIIKILFKFKAKWINKHKKEIQYHYISYGTTKTIILVSLIPSLF